MTRHMRPRFTPAEDAILRAIWPLPLPLKASMHRLPGRDSVQAATRASHLGLGKRPVKFTGSSVSVCRMAIERELRSLPQTRARLMVATGFSHFSVHSQVASMHAAGEIHIERWHLGKGSRRRFSPVYAVGAGVDATKPTVYRLRHQPLGTVKVDRFPGAFQALTARPVVGLDVPFGTMVAA